MTRKIYRTAQGKPVDLGALQLQNENVRAVGNMGVNARGDLIDGWNRPIEEKNKNVRKTYDRQISNVKDEPVTKSPIDTSAKKSKAAKPPKVKIPDPPEDFNDNFQKEPEASQSSGLASAIAKARAIREQPIMSHSEMVKNRPGVSKI